ncbi:MAG: 3-isopropylmalate dehydratase large subunit [Phycisphaerales bacterium]|nr:3-isopropylmalate dehydratase large subunit [Phycisphaerales bacterium]
MGMTITEKILAAHAGRDNVTPGEKVWCKVDVLLTHDVCGPGTIGIFEEEFGEDASVFDPEGVVIIPDHYIFTADDKAQRNIEILRSFAAKHKLPYYYDPDFIPSGGCPGEIPPCYPDPRNTNYGGVCHVALPERGHARPGEILIGTDSHTCTHGAFGQFATGMGNTDAAFVLGTGKTWLMVPESQKFTFTGELPWYIMGKDLVLHAIGEIGFDGATYGAMEFDGETVMSLNIDERCTMTNMAIEAGGKNGIIAADALTEEFVQARTDKPYTKYESDPDANYLATFTYDASTLEPTVAKPHSPGNRATVREVAGTKIDRSYIGSCTGGKTTDMLAAAMVLNGKKVTVDTFIVPATPAVDISLDELKVDGKSLREIFTESGCRIGPAGCAACLGGPQDTFGRANEPLTVVSTTNRNFPGRMGHKEAQIYLASPLTAAASAITGELTDPRDVVTLTGPVGTRE